MISGWVWVAFALANDAYYTHELSYIALDAFLRRGYLVPVR